MTAFPNLPQEVTYWRTAPDGYGGHIFSSPVHTKGRWEVRIQLLENADGEGILSNARVYLPGELQDILGVDDYLAPGHHAVADPTTLRRARRIVGVNAVPDLRGRSFTLRIFL